MCPIKDQKIIQIAMVKGVMSAASCPHCLLSLNPN